MNNRQLRIWAPVALAVVFAAGLWMGKILFSSDLSKSPVGKLNNIVQLIEDRYVDEINTDSLLEEAIPDIMAMLDPHSVYISKKDLAAVNSELDGSFSGIGISFNILSDTIVIVEVISGGPSEKAGLQPGDRILEIDDTCATGKKWSNEGVQSKLRGEADTEVKLKIQRSTSKTPLEFTITRGEVPMNTVEAAYLTGTGTKAKETGYIRVGKFGRTTYDEFITALRTLEDQGAKSYIIDVRGNGGGFMEMAILMANEFLPAQKVIVSTIGRDFSDGSMVFSDGTGSYCNVPLVVLIDEYSASASEIFAGAIQDNDRGAVIGRRSFGKGLVQQQYPLADSSAVRLTVARYYTPSGRCIQKDYKPGSLDAYMNDLTDRYNHGESYHVDSIRQDSSKMYHTVAGREVFGGGGIMPDIFVPADTTGITTYYLEVSNAGHIQRFAFETFEKNREKYSSASSVGQLLEMLPSDTQLLRDFSIYAASKGAAYPYWKTINQSRRMIVKSIKASIARDALGMDKWFEIYNTDDETVLQGLSILDNGYGIPGAPVPPTETNAQR